MLNVLVCVNEFILSLFILCPVLVYLWYANIGPWWVETELDIFLNTKNMNISITFLNNIFFTTTEIMKILFVELFYISTLLLMYMIVV